MRTPYIYVIFSSLLTMALSQTATADEQHIENAKQRWQSSQATSLSNLRHTETEAFENKATAADLSSRFKQYEKETEARLIADL